ncbi:MAG: hypothetical protein HYY18_09985 [Planctomycetes bacterium]|nr:hypothetical protein [Planctomycetota bacterium]
MPPNIRRLILTAVSSAVALYIAIQLRHVQFATDHLVSRDGYYHTRYANLLWQRGLSREFAWTQHSFWKDRFADKELLFHVWLAPFCRGDAALVRHGKFAAWLLAGLVLAGFGLALRFTEIRAPLVWTFLLFSSGNHFLFRLSECRAHVLSILFFVAGMALLLKGKWKWLIPLGFLYSWSYAAPHFLIGLAIVHAAATGLWERRLEWRGVAFAAGGVAAGMLIHPYFPNNLHLWYVQNVVVLKQAWGLGGDLGLHLGEEFGSILPRSLVMSSTAVFISLVGGSLLAVLAARAGRLSARSFTLLLVLYACFSMYCLSARFIEYFAPAAVWALASVASDLVTAEGLAAAWRDRRGSCAWAGAAALVAIALLHMRTMDRTLEEVRKTKGPVMAGAARWTRANVPAGKNIVHLNWGDFVQLFHFDPDHRYINGLDPAFMYVTDTSRVRYLEDVRTGREPVVAKDLAEVFNAEILVVTREVPRQVRMCEDALLDRLYEDEGAIVYSLKPIGPAPGD